MRKVYITFALLMIAVLLGTVGCSAAPSELAPCTVEFGYVSNEWQGQETVAANVFVTIKNPNPVPVTLSSLDYKLYMNDTELATKTMVPAIMIPANGSVSLNNISVIDYSMTLAVNPYYLKQGKTYVSAHMAAIPVWKLLGGKLPDFWANPNIGILAGLRAGPVPSGIAAGTADVAATTIYSKVRAGIDAVQGAIDQAYAAAPSGPGVYGLKGKATITYGSMSKDTTFDLTYEKK
ncbi:MAG: LEA type 2 family protein [Chloroflexi bacterium]|nr:LEA type 2 family protein [Chloroflexota bacterium]